MDMLNSWEIGILHWIHDVFSCEFLDTVMPYITKFADNGIGWIILALILLIPRKTRRTGASMAVALLLGFITGNLFLKNIVARTRPFYWDPTIVLLIETPSEFSFPSGHTLASFECATAIFHYNRKWGIAALLFAGFIAFSRLYLQVHYLTDVLCGAMFGILWGYVGCRIVEALDKRIIRNKKLI